MRSTLLTLVLCISSGLICAQHTTGEYFRIAKYRFDHGDLEQALAYCRHSIDADPRNISAWLLKADINYSLGNFAGTIADIDKAFRLDEHNGRFLADQHILLAKAYTADNQWGNALKALDHAVSITNANPDVYYERALVYHNLERAREAIADLDHAITLYSKDARYYADRARIRFSHYSPEPGTAAYEQVLKDIEAAIAFRPALFDYRQLKCTIIHQNTEYTMQDRLMDYSRLVQLFPDEPKAYRERGLLYMQNEDFGSAIKDFTKAISRGLKDAHCYRYRALSYHNLFQYDNALDDFTAAIDLLEKSWRSSTNADHTEFVLGETYFLRGNTYLLKKIQNEACADFRKAHDCGSKKGTNYYRKYCNIY